MNTLITILTKSGLLTEDLDYHVVRAAMVILFLFFGYQKWFAYEAQGLIPYISHGPLIAWMYPVFGIRGASWFLGVAEWVCGALLFAGFWKKRLGILGSLGSTGLNLSHKLSFALSWEPLHRGGPPWHISTREPVPMPSFGTARRSQCQRWKRWNNG